jgi:hypothetical protein
MVLFCAVAHMTEIRQCRRCKSLALLRDNGNRTPDGFMEKDTVVDHERVDFICPCAEPVSGSHKFKDGAICKDSLAELRKRYGIGDAEPK